MYFVGERRNDNLNLAVEERFESADADGATPTHVDALPTGCFSSHNKVSQSIQFSHACGSRVEHGEGGEFLASLLVSFLRNSSICQTAVYIHNYVM